MLVTSSDYDYTREVIDKLKNKMPYEAYQAYWQSEYLGNSGFSNFFPPGSGFFNRFKERHPDFVQSDGRLKMGTETFEAIDKDGKMEMLEMKKYVEDLRRDCGNRPVSASAILQRFLDWNDGELSDSIYDTAIFLKFMARNDIDSGEFSADQTNVEWMKKNILDEYQGTNYNDEHDEVSVLNLIGKPYHSWNLVALLKYFPLEIVKAGALQRALISLDEQGLGKVRGDIQTVKSMGEIERLLLEYVD